MPVISYACQVWITIAGLFKLFNNGTLGIDDAKKVSLDPLENLYLALLKWTMGVHKSTSNSAEWGDCGRYPQLALNSPKWSSATMNVLKVWPVITHPAW